MSTGDEPLRDVLAVSDGRPVALVDGRNVQRSTWPDVSDGELVRRTRAWAEREGVYAVVAFDGDTPAAGDGERCAVVPVRGESADDWLARAATALAEAGVPYVLVTSDRELRRRAGGGARSLIGGGGFLARAP